jgi:hypothetical protein
MTIRDLRLLTDKRPFKPDQVEAFLTSLTALPPCDRELAWEESRLISAWTELDLEIPAHLPGPIYRFDFDGCDAQRWRLLLGISFRRRETWAVSLVVTHAVSVTPQAVLTAASQAWATWMAPE